MADFVVEIASHDSFWKIANIKDVIGIFGLPLAIITFIVTQQLAKYQTRATNMINLLNIYLKTSEYRRDALIDNKVPKIYLYWTSLMDLHWTQYDLWNRGYINNRAMTTWCYGKYLNYRDKEGIKDKDGNSITYKKVWEEHINNGYFPPGDDFKDIMNYVHHDIKLDPTDQNKSIEIQQKIKAKLKNKRKFLAKRVLGWE